MEVAAHMKNHRKSIFFSLTLFIMVGILFNSVPQSYAQTEEGWSQPVNLSHSGIATNPVLLIDFQNVLHAIWLHGVDGFMYSQSPDGIAWTKPQKVEFPFFKEGPPPVLISDPNGSIHIFWISRQGELRYGKTTPNNLSYPRRWQIGTPLARDVLKYDVIVDAQSVLHLAFILSKNSDLYPAGIYYRQSIIGGGVWRRAIKLYESEYFRSTSASEASISIAAENTTATSPSARRVYVTWDNRPQKRVFLAISEDAGVNWSGARQVKGPQETSGSASPFNLSVTAIENNVLLVWQEAEAGSERCSVLSQWSANGGEDWQNTVAVFDWPIICPSDVRFVLVDENHVAVVMTGRDEPTLLAWNTIEWSEPQSQTQLPVLLSPETFDPILMACRFDLIHQNRLYVAGCDEGQGGDIWFLSRSLAPVDDWFSPSKIWDAPDPIMQEIKKNEITNLSSVTDQNGNMHTVWVQSSADSIALEYARWTNHEWLQPSAVLSSFSATPVDISPAVDTKGRLLLAWVDGSSGELFFNWATLDTAYIASEWREPVGLPSVSSLNSSPDIVADAAGRIVVAYTVPINEKRGVYVVQSSDGGNSWSAPIRVFDAVLQGWERIATPKINLSVDGTLHLTFVRKSARVGQPVGLYYSNSMDGGITWSNPQILSEGDIQWNDIVSYGDHILQVLWQEYDGLVAANLAQVSQDGGRSWSRSINVTGVSDRPTPVSLASDGSGQLHFVQLLRDHNGVATKQDHLILQDWEWSGSLWELAAESNILVMGDVIDYSAAAGLTSDGFLSVLISTEYSGPRDELRNDIEILNRFVGQPSSDLLTELALLPTPAVLSAATAVPNVSPTQPVDLSVLYENSISTTPGQRNIVGMVIIGVATIVTVLLLFWRRPASNKK
jgi:hypothetical protein